MNPAKTLPALLLATTFASPLMAAGELPAPYISRALDAVLLPVNDDVIAAFGLNGDETGVLVLAVEPDGVASAAGIEPGDVIAQVSGHAITDPISLDEVVYYWITQSNFDFVFDGWRAGAAYTVNSTITQESYVAVIDLVAVESWSSWSSESFSYAEYYSSYSEEFTASYESSETTIEESASSEEFAADISSDDGDTDNDGTMDTDDADDDGDGVDDSDDTDDDGDGVDDAEDSDDGGDDE